MNKYIWVGALVLLTACSGKHEAGKSQFARAIEAYNQDHPVCLPLAPSAEIDGGQASIEGRFGDEWIRILTEDVTGKSINRVALKKLLKQDHLLLAEQIKEGQKARATVVLTNEGWRDIRSLQ